MSAKYETGRPYMATVNGEPNRRVVRDPNGDWFTCDEGELVWGGTAITEPVDLSEVRPLVVLDEPDFYYETAVPELREAAQEGGRSLRLHRILNSIADQIEAQTRPPKPAEPQGLGAVVEDSEGHRWVRNPVTATDELPWWRSDLGGPYPYAELDVVRVLSEGVQP